MVILIVAEYGKIMPVIIVLVVAACDRMMSFIEP